MRRQELSETFETAPEPPAPPKNVLARVGFGLALAELSGTVFNFAEITLLTTTFLSFPGLMVSLRASHRESNSLAKCGIFLGALGSMLMLKFWMYLSMSLSQSYLR